MYNIKPFVNYKPTATQFIRVGESACVFPINHESNLVSNTTLIATSEVINYDKETGRFETRNTVYIPVE